jgi:tetratricopeptide (TPR) repeat protein
LRSHADALTYYEKSTAIRERIDPSRLPGVTPRLAESIMNEGVMLWGQSKITQAEEKFQSAEKILLSIRPEERFTQGNGDPALGMVYMNWSGMLHLSGNYKEAIARADAGLSRIEPYLKTEPNDAPARDLCLKLHGNRAYALSALGKHRDSAADWIRVVGLSPEPVPAGYRTRLAIELLGSDKIEQALIQARLVQPSTAIPGYDRYDLGCIFARAAAEAQTDKGVPQDQRARRFESHVSDAFRWLKSAADVGFFRDPAERDHAKKDSDLAIVADRIQFHQLIEADAAKPANKGK